MSERFAGEVVPVDPPLGREAQRWRVPLSHPAKRLRLLERGDGWGVLWQVDGAQLRVYPTREMAEDVCQRLMAADGDTWREIPLPAQWWA